MAATRTRRATTKPAAKAPLTVVETPQPAPAASNGKAQQTLADRAKKAPTQLHKDFAEWLTAQTGHEADVKTVQLAVLLIGEYQKSPERQAAREAAQQANATALAERKAATEKKAAERKKKLEDQIAALQAQLTK